MESMDVNISIFKLNFVKINKCWEGIAGAMKAEIYITREAS
jgi:hypothetical protein